MADTSNFEKQETEEMSQPEEGPINEDIVDMLTEAAAYGLSPSQSKSLEKFNSIGKQFSKWLNISEASAQMDVQRQMSGRDRMITWALLVLGGLAAYRYFIANTPEEEPINGEDKKKDSFEDMEVDDMMGDQEESNAKA